MRVTQEDLTKPALEAALASNCASTGVRIRGFASSRDEHHPRCCVPFLRFHLQHACTKHDAAMCFCFEPPVSSCTLQQARSAATGVHRQKAPNVTSQVSMCLNHDCNLPSNPACGCLTCVLREYSADVMKIHGGRHGMRLSSATSTTCNRRNGYPRACSHTSFVVDTPYLRELGSLR